MPSPGTVIIGAGQGGYQVAASLREYGYQEPITVVGDEPQLPYQRPPLSKAYLLGDTTAERLLLRPQNYYEKHAIEVLTGNRAVAIDRQASKIALASGTAIAYDHLVLATGARNRTLPVEGAELDGVMYLRTIADADEMKARFAAANTIVIAGAGFIGLELAAVASKFGKTVYVVEALARVMSRALMPTMSEFFASAHAAFGVELLLNARMQSIQGNNGHVAAVTLSDGRKVPADLVLVGIGIEPVAELAAECGLPVANGISVNAQLATADPKVSAIGDCASFPDSWTGQTIRLESVQNAVDQGRCVARRITGQPADYGAVPWFWSDQRDLKLQMVGLTAGCDRTAIRGSIADRAFSVFCFKGDKLIGIESVNRPADHMFGRRLLAAGANVTPDEAADMSFDFKARLASVEPAREKVAG
jgi:3-phenylpropionate/trans-cinnamate dioxygenase ferredoxin reductase subunit